MVCEVFMATGASQSNIAQSKLRIRLEISLIALGLLIALAFAFVLSLLITFANNDGTINYLPDILEAVQWILDVYIHLFVGNRRQVPYERYFGVLRIWHRAV